MEPLRVWSFRRVFWIALAWIIIAQVMLFWRTFASAMAIIRTHPETSVYSYLSSVTPPVPGAGLLVVGPPLVLVATWWWIRRSKSAA